MKENKFLFYGCVVLTIVCAMWLHFHMPHDIEFVYKPNVETLKDADSEDFFIDVPEKDSITDDFTECSSRFKSQIWAKDFGDKTTERYHATNVITCKCEVGNTVVEKTMTYQYSSEPDQDELDCNNKCVEICAE